MVLFLETRRILRCKSWTPYRVPLPLRQEYEAGDNLGSHQAVIKTIKQNKLALALFSCFGTPGTMRDLAGRDEKNGTPGTIRTCGLQFRKLTLYPAELRVQICRHIITYLR